MLQYAESSLKYQCVLIFFFVVHYNRWSSKNISVSRIVLVSIHFLFVLMLTVLSTSFNKHRAVRSVLFFLHVEVEISSFMIRDPNKAVKLNITSLSKDLFREKRKEFAKFWIYFCSVLKRELKESERLRPGVQDLISKKYHDSPIDQNIISLIDTHEIIQKTVLISCLLQGVYGEIVKDNAYDVICVWFRFWIE